MDVTQNVALDILELSCLENEFARNLWNFSPLLPQSSSLTFNIVQLTIFATKLIEVLIYMKHIL